MKIDRKKALEVTGEVSKTLGLDAKSTETVRHYCLYCFISYPSCRSKIMYKLS